MITNEADLKAAVQDGGVIQCDPNTTIPLSSAVQIDLPTQLIDGTFLVESGPAFQVNCGNVEIAGISITGNSAGGYDQTQKLIYVLGEQYNPLSHVRIHDCLLLDSAADNIWMEWCVDSIAHDNMINHALYSGVMVISGDGVVVSDNVISDVLIAQGQVECYGIAITDLLNTAAARSKRCVVSGNRVHQVDWEGIDTHGGDGIVVTGNAVTACRRGLALVTGNASRLTAPQRCVASGNAIDGTGARVTADIGAFLAGAAGLPASATITDNTIAGYDSSPAMPISTTNWDRTNTIVAGNSRPHVPWTAVALANGWSPNASFPPQYMVDGNTVSLRGGAIPPAGGASGNPAIGSLSNAAAWPSARTFYAVVKGSNAVAGIGTLNVDTTGALRLDYASRADAYTYWLNGSYQAI